MITPWGWLRGVSSEHVITAGFQTLSLITGITLQPNLSKRQGHLPPTDHWSLWPSITWNYTSPSCWCLGSAGVLSLPVLGILSVIVFVLFNWIHYVKIWCCSGWWCITDQTCTTVGPVWGKWWKHFSVLKYCEEEIVSNFLNLFSQWHGLTKLNIKNIKNIKSITYNTMVLYVLWFSASTMVLFLYYGVISALWCYISIMVSYHHYDVILTQGCCISIF